MFGLVACVTKPEQVNSASRIVWPSDVGHVQSSEPVVWLHRAARWSARTPGDTRSWSRQTRWRWTFLCVVCLCVGMTVCSQMTAAVVLTPISPLSHRHTPAQKYEVQVGAGIWHINTFFSLFALVSTPLQAEEHLSSKSLQTTAVLNLIKDITDNRRPIKQASFQRSTGGHISRLPGGLQHTASQLSNFSK